MCGMIKGSESSPSLNLSTFFNAPLKSDANPAEAGGVGLKRMLVNFKVVSFADALLLRVSQTHLLSCQTPQPVITD